MPTTYKGLTIPLSSDLADGPQCFRDYTDSLPASDAFLEGMLPVGSIVASCRTAAPVNWFLLDGATVPNAQTAYPRLWAVVPASWQSGTDLILPDARGRVLAMLDPADTAIDAIGEKVGAKTLVLVSANLPAHAHAQQGTLTSGGASARHRHGTTGGGQFVETAFAAGLQLPAGSGAVGANLTNTDTPDHTHQVTLSGNTGNGPGTASPISLVQPTLVMNFMVKAA